jgi:hypothetical protein
MRMKLDVGGKAISDLYQYEAGRYNSLAPSVQALPRRCAEMAQRPFFGISINGRIELRLAPENGSSSSIVSRMSRFALLRRSLSRCTGSGYA